MPEKHRHAPPLPARFLDLLAALPAVAWLEDAGGNILARNRDPAPDDHPAVTAAYPLPPVDGNTRPLRLVAQVSGADENGCHARMISALLSLVLGAERPASLRLTPRQRDIYRQLSQGHCYKTIAARLGLTHDAVRQQIVTLRRKLGSSHIPLLRRRIHHKGTKDTEKDKKAEDRSQKTENTFRFLISVLWPLPFPTFATFVPCRTTGQAPRSHITKRGMASCQERAGLQARPLLPSR